VAREEAQLALILFFIASVVVQAQRAVKPPSDGVVVPNIRPGTTALRQVFKTAYMKSQTFRALVDELEGSHVVVFLASGQCGGRFAGCLRLLAADDRAVSLRVVIDDFQRPEAEIASLLGHELEHAAELARAREVRDEQTMRRLFERIGQANGHGYETARATKVGRIVEREIRSWRERRAP